MRPTELCRFRLAWDEPGREGRQRVTVGLHLPVVGREAWGALAADVEVQERVALLRAARLKKEATAHLERGDRLADDQHLFVAPGDGECELPCGCVGAQRNEHGGCPRQSERRKQRPIRDRCERRCADNQCQQGRPPDQTSPGLQRSGYSASRRSESSGKVRA